jgi:hypothetical protein
MSETQFPSARCLINDIIPAEILGAIFEEHAKLEWRAPVIDGRVCRLWWQIVLSSPRAWAYYEINDHTGPSIGQFIWWLRRSGAAPLHISIYTIFPLYGDTTNRAFYDLLGDICARIASLRMRLARLSFFDGRDFPCLRLLDVQGWFRPDDLSAATFRWGSMPLLHSLHLGATEGCMSLVALPPCKMLALYRTNCTSLTQHSRSLTSLLLEKISCSNIISGLVTFPSLTYLSLYDVCGLKPHIDAPCLATYHEGGSTEMESFPAPLRSLVEYGEYAYAGSKIPDDMAITRWHDSFPNITRFAIRSPQTRLISLFGALAQHPHALPAVQTIGVEEELTYEQKRVLEGFIRARSEACHMNITLHFETGDSYKLPMFFAMVSHASRAMVSGFLTCFTESRMSCVTVVESRVCPIPPECNHSHTTKSGVFGLS